MKLEMLNYLASSGLIASVWIIFGVYLAAKFYPNYSHRRQFCSELGAKGCPTEKLSPIINNYPLGVLFCLFGFSVIQIQSDSLLSIIAGYLVIIHGIGTWIAGYFPMDADPYTKAPTIECKIHSWAGIVMILTLFVAPILIFFSPTDENITVSFKVFSIFCVVLTLIFMLALAKAYKNNADSGLQQRLSYGTQLLWLSGLSLTLIT